MNFPFGLVAMKFFAIDFFTTKKRSNQYNPGDGWKESKMLAIKKCRYESMAWRSDDITLVKDVKKPDKPKEADKGAM